MAFGKCFRGHCFFKHLLRKRFSSKTFEITDLQTLIKTEELEQKLSDRLRRLNKFIAQHCTMRTSANAFANLCVKVDGENKPLGTLAQLIQRTPALVVVNVKREPGLLEAVLNAIASSMHIGTAQVSDNSVFIPVMKMTKEHHKAAAERLWEVLYDHKKETGRIVHPYQVEVRTKCSSFTEPDQKVLVGFAQSYLLEKTKATVLAGENIIKTKVAEHTKA